VDECRDVLNRAIRGDEHAFNCLVGPYLTRCYRPLVPWTVTL